MKSEALGPKQTMQGIVLDRNHIGKITEEWDGQFVIASVAEPGVELSYQTTFDPAGHGRRSLETICARTASWRTAKIRGQAAVNRLPERLRCDSRWSLARKKIVPMVIAWDLPVVEFGSGRKWYRRYTDYYGTSGLNAWAIAKDALKTRARGARRSMRGRLRM